MRSDDAVSVDLVELRWIHGLLGVLSGDESRVQRARRELLADTARASSWSARSLNGLWLARSDASFDAGADTLRAVTDAAMRAGSVSILTVEAINRFVIARALRKRGAAAEVEHYLMWPDASSPIARDLSVKMPLNALVNYERSLALEEAGNRSSAVYRLRRLLTAYDQPPSVHRALVDDARRRLARLERSDAPANRAVAPR